MKINFGTEIEIDHNFNLCSLCSELGIVNASEQDWQEVACEACDGTRYCEDICQERCDRDSICFYDCESCEYYEDRCTLCLSAPSCEEENPNCAKCPYFEEDYFCFLFPIHAENNEICERCIADGTLAEWAEENADQCDGCLEEDTEVEIISIITDPLSDQIRRIYYDQSVGPEIVSIPMTKEELKEFHKKVVELLDVQGYEITPYAQAGGHITISIQDRDDQYVDLDLSEIASSIYNIVSRFYPIFLINSCESATFNRGSHYRAFPEDHIYQKYQAIRLRTRYQLEFRYPDGTMDEKIFNRTVDLIYAIVNYALEEYFPSPTPEELRLSKNLSHQIMNTPNGFEKVRNSVHYFQMLRDFQSLFSRYSLPPLLEKGGEEDV